MRPQIVKTREAKPQTELENSHQQFKNVWGAFAAEVVVAGEPVLEESGETGTVLPDPYQVALALG